MAEKKSAPSWPNNTHISERTGRVRCWNTDSKRYEDKHPVDIREINKQTPGMLLPREPEKNEKVEDDEGEVTEDHIKKMNTAQIKKFVKDRRLNIALDEFDSLDEKREAVITALNN